MRHCIHFISFQIQFMGQRTILPAWSLNMMPLVFIILRYGLLKLLILNPWGWGQGADMSLSTTYFLGSWGIFTDMLAYALLS